MEAAGSRHPAVRLAAATASGRCLTGELLGGLFLRDLAQIASTGAQLHMVPTLTRCNLLLAGKMLQSQPVLCVIHLRLSC